MKREALALDELTLDIFRALGERWMLLAAGTAAPGKFNMMTVSWGALGVLWDKPIAIVFVRPTRHTHKFMEESDSFTLSAFPAQFGDALLLCGTKSGRDVDKAREAGLTPVASTRVAAPSFDEAELVLECRKLYFSDINPANFATREIGKHYPKRDYHRCYIGEVVAVHGAKKFTSAG